MEQAEAVEAVAVITRDSRPTDTVLGIDAALLRRSCWNQN